MLNTIIRAALGNRIVVLALAAAALAYGLMSADRLTVDVLPDLTRPRVVLLTECHGLAPEEVESQVTLPLEIAARQANGVQAVRSISEVGISIVYVEFDWGQDPLVARQMVQERIATVIGSLPPDVRPQMGPISSLLGQIMTIGMWSEDGAVGPLELRSLADWVVRQRLRAIGGVAQVITMGGGRMQYQVLVDPHLLHKFDVTLHEVETALAAGNLNVSGGYITDGAQELLVRGIGRVRDVADIQQIVVSSRPGRSVLVRDVADVRTAAQVKRGDSSVNGREAVVITVQKQPGADTRQLTEDAKEALRELRESLPPGVRLVTTYEQREFIDFAVDNVAEAVRDGAILVAVVLLLFLLNVRTTLITLTAIPLSILATAIVFRWQGLSINVMTLGGIAVALGELVDDAIVDVENIYRRLRENRLLDSPRPAAAVIFEASSEVRGAILMSTIMVVLVFAPLFALSGMAGRMFTPLGVAYVVSILASTVVSLTVTPVLSYYLLTRRGERRETPPDPRAPQGAEEPWPPGTRPAGGGPAAAALGGKSPRGEGPVVRAAQAAARPLVRWSLTTPGFVLVGGASAMLVVAALAALLTIGRDFLPSFDEGAAQVNLTLRPGTALETSREVSRQADQLLLPLLSDEQTPHAPLRWFTARTGRAEEDEHVMGVHVTEYVMALNPRSPLGREELLELLGETLQPIAGVDVEIEQPIAHMISHMLSGVTAQIAIKIFGDDLTQLRRAANDVKAAVEDLPGLREPVVESMAFIPQLRIEVKRPQLALYGITPEYVQEMIETALNGRVVSTVFSGQRRFDLLVRFAEEHRKDIGSFERLPIELPDGTRVPLAEVARVYRAAGPNVINREDTRRRLVVRVNTDQQRDLDSAVRDIRRRIDERVELPQGCFVTLGGQFEEERTAARRLVVLGAMSLAGVFLLLLHNFQRVSLVLQILGALPLAMVGGVAALLLTGQTLTVAGMVGFISLSGIAARNGILLIEAYRRRERPGRPASRQQLVEASLERLSPVLMTALTTGLGLAPLVVGGHLPGKEMLYPVATVVVGGLVTSTIAELLLRPGLYWHLRR